MNRGCKAGLNKKLFEFEMENLEDVRMKTIKEHNHVFDFQYLQKLILRNKMTGAASDIEATPRKIVSTVLRGLPSDIIVNSGSLDSHNQFLRREKNKT